MESKIGDLRVFGSPGEWHVVAAFGMHDGGDSKGSTGEISAREVLYTRKIDCPCLHGLFESRLNQMG